MYKAYFYENNINVMRLGLVLGSFILISMFLLSPVFATTSLTNSTCVGTESSEVNITIATFQNGIQNSTTISQNVNCPYGCNGATGYCNQSSIAESGFTASLIPMLMALGLFAIGMMWKIVDPWDFIYRILFIFFGLFFAISAIATSNALIAISPEISAAVTSLSINNVVNSTYLLWILVGFLIFFTIFKVIYDYLAKSKMSKEKDDGDR